MADNGISPERMDEIKELMVSTRSICDGGEIYHAFKELFAEIDRLNEKVRVYQNVMIADAQEPKSEK